MAILYSFFNSKASKFVSGRRGAISGLKEKFQGNVDEVIWFHCSSLGEFEMSIPLIEKLQNDDLKTKILVTFFSPSGYEIRKDYPGIFYVSYLPIDSLNNANLFLDIVRPKKIFFAKYDLWFHYLNESKKRNIKLYLFNASFNKKQIFFKWYGGLFRRILSFFETVFLLNQKSNKLLKSINIKNTLVVGDTRFDKVYQTVQEAKKLPTIERFKNGNKLLIIGSSWKEDIDVVLPFLISVKKIKIIIAPHEIGEDNLRYIESKSKNKSIRYSQLNTVNQNQNILIIDNIGMLSSIYRYGDIAYIGGAFRTGLHNILEAATFGMPIIFGPHYSKFPEALSLIENEGATSIKNSQEFEIAFNSVYLNETNRIEKSNICKSFVKNNRGSADKILENVIK